MGRRSDYLTHRPHRLLRDRLAAGGVSRPLTRLSSGQHLGRLLPDAELRVRDSLSLQIMAMETAARQLLRPAAGKPFPSRANAGAGAARLPELPQDLRTLRDLLALTLRDISTAADTLVAAHSRLPDLAAAIQRSRSASAATLTQESQAMLALTRLPDRLVISLLRS